MQVHSPQIQPWRMGLPMLLAAALVSVAGLFFNGASRAWAADATVPPPPAQEEPEVLTRGPVHEAFAEPVNLQSQAGLVVTTEPPAPVEEAAPAERPEGNFVWVPGYWGWDTDRSTFIWVSGCWRAAPPNTYWVPGYWEKVTGGWEWIPGFWAQAGTQEIEYLPAPPQPIDVEPVGVAPSVDYTWVPGCWYWREDQYIRRDGYWLAAQPSWVWVPSHYVWTPRGYVFAAGHWDYPLESRGVLFAPVYIPRPVYTRPGFIFSAGVVVDLGALRLNLFTHPRYCHYFYGDYYDTTYVNVGIYPFFDRRHIYDWCDPIYEHDRWRFGRGDRHWEERQRHDFEVRRDDRNLRPPRTFAEMQTRVAKAPEAERRGVEIERPLRTVAASKDAPLKFAAVNPAARAEIAHDATEVQNFRQERIKWEGAKATPGAAERPAPLDRGATPAERRDATPSATGKPAPAATVERRDSTPTPTERRDATPSTTGKPAPPATVERRDNTPTPAERRDTKPSTTGKPAPPGAVERRDTTPTPAERRDATPSTTGKPAPPATVERRDSTPTPAERREATPAPAGKAPSDERPSYVAPREVHVTAPPDRVKVPSAPYGGRSGDSGSGQGAPARPSGEDGRRGGGDSGHSHGTPAAGGGGGGAPSGGSGGGGGGGGRGGGDQRK